jgi:phage shock protein C
VSGIKLNRTNARCLGVCAGVADWLDVPTTLVRVIFVICVISWPTLIIGYFVLYFCLDKDITPESVRDYFNNGKTADHFRQVNYRKPIYKNQRNKRIAGVCSGIADYLEVSAFSVRLATLLSLFVFGPFTFWAYIICMFVFDPDPNAPYSERFARRRHRKEARAARKEPRAQRKEARRARKHGIPESYVNDEEMLRGKDAARDFADKPEFESNKANGAGSSYSANKCSKTFSTLEQRLRAMEAYMTSKRFRLHCEINRI